MPTLNEEKGLEKTINAINLQYFKKHGWHLEIAIIDGLSQDKTQQIAKEKGVSIFLEKRKGYGRAYKTGMPLCSGDIIVTGDADATYPFDKIHLYITQLLEENLDFITTDRFAQLKQGSMTIKHRFGNLILATVLRLLFLINIKDSQSGMWIFRKQALENIQPLERFDDGMPFSEEIKIEMFTSPDLRCKEIPSTLYVREGDVKLQSFQDGWKNLKFLFKKRVNHSAH